MGISGAMFAMSAATAVSQISQGYAQKSEADYNASIIENEAKLIKVQSEIEQGQYQRLKGEYLSKSTSVAAAQGITLQGSTVAAMIGTRRQIEIDQAIAKFNATMNVNYKKSEADAYRRQGKAAVRSGYMNAFSSLLQGASSYAQQKKAPQKSTFDYNTKTPSQAFGGAGRSYSLPSSKTLRTI